MAKHPTGDELQRHLNNRIVEKVLRDETRIWVPPETDPDENPSDPRD